MGTGSSGVRGSLSPKGEGLGEGLGEANLEWEGSTSGGGGVLVRVFGYLETGGSLLRKRRVLGREASGEEGGLGEVEGIIAY